MPETVNLATKVRLGLSDPRDCGQMRDSVGLNEDHHEKGRRAGHNVEGVIGLSVRADRPGDSGRAGAEDDDDVIDLVRGCGPSDAVLNEP